MLSGDYGINRFRILANMVNSASEGNAVFRKILAQFFDNHSQHLSYAGFIPRDKHLLQAIVGHRAVVHAYPRSRSAMALKNLARQTMSWPHPGQPGGHLEFFVERIIQNDNGGMEVAS
jgi:flagellar biosynthesis protein FlhG